MEESKLLDRILARVNEIASADNLIGERYSEDGQPVCYYCGDPILGYSETDHVIPQSRQGIDHPSNYVQACTSCNSSKQAQHPLIWFLRGGHASKPANIPDDLAIDFLARLIISSYWSYHNCDDEHTCISLSAWNPKLHTGSYYTTEPCDKTFTIPIGSGWVAIDDPCLRCGNETTLAACSAGAFIISQECPLCHDRHVFQARPAKVKDIQ